MPSARGSTFAPPPGMNPTGMSAWRPLSTSLKPPSPEKTYSALRPAASRASSVACPGRSVRRTSTSPSASTTSSKRSSETELAKGLTIRSGRSIVATMPRLDHVAFETADPDALAAFYERFLNARIVRAEGHPVMAYLGNTGLALHPEEGPGEHTAIRVTEAERAELRRRLDAAGIEWRERDHEIAVGL